jgi:uroporphyrinogen-III synthase
VKALVTRPREDAAAFAAALAERGIETMIEPLLTIRMLPGPVSLDGVRAVLFTSANGARALAAATPRRDLRVLAVGDASAAASRALGFAEVASAAGDVDDLARLAGRLLAPDAGVLLHVAASTVAGDLAGALTAAGFTVRRAVLYEAEPAQALTPETTQALHEGRLDAAFFFSPRTATTFVSLAAAAVPGAAARMAAFCLSPAVARATETLGWRELHVAAAPSQAELLALLDERLVLAGSRRAGKGIAG